MRVAEAHVREFESYLKAQVASGDMDPRAAAGRLLYLRLALEELGLRVCRPQR